MENLTKVLELRTEYYRVREQLIELEAMATHMTSVITGMPRGTAKENNAAWTALADTKTYYEKLATEYLDALCELEENLDKIEPVQIRTAMKFRYLNGYTVEATAEVMNYSVRNMYNLLKRGKKLYEKL